MLTGTTSMKLLLLLSILQVFVQYGHGQSICGSVSFSGNSGYLTSPYYPGNYYDGIDCTQTIYGRSNRLLELTFLSFSTESCCDRVTITTSDGSQYGPYSGSSPSNIVITSSSYVTINFFTDGSVVDTGFQLRWRYLNHACSYSGGNSCHEDATCTNTDIYGGYTCRCDGDYVGDGYNSCIGYCLSPELNDCHEDATCTIDRTEDRHYTCQCNDDFIGDGFNCIETYSYCFRAEVLGNITEIRELSDPETEMRNALNTTFQRYEGDIDEFFVNGFNVTIIEEPTNSSTLIINICFDQITKTADELGRIFINNDLVNLNYIYAVFNETDITTVDGTVYDYERNGTDIAAVNGTFYERNGTITWALNDFNECDSNYLGCHEEAICENTMGTAICACPVTRYDFEENTELTGMNCTKPMEFNCDGFKANISLLIPYWSDKYINVSNVFVNDNCSGTTDGIWHNYNCNGTVTVNTTHLMAEFRVADVVPIGGFSINRLDTTVKCIQPALQNFTGSIESEETVVDPVIETAETAQSSLQAEVFVGGFENRTDEGMRTGDMACIKVSDPNIPESIRTMIKSFHTSAPGATSTFTLVEDYCPVEVAGLETEATNIGICFTMHRPQGSRTLEVKLVVNFCTIEDCPTPSCLSGRNHVQRSQKQSQELQEISFTINIAPDDTCNRDCEAGACLLDDHNQQRCICSDNSVLTPDGKCKVPGNEAVSSDGNVAASGVDIMVIVVGLLAGAFVLCLLGMAAYFFTRRRKADHVSDIQLKMQEVYTNTIDQE